MEFPQDFHTFSKVTATLPDRPAGMLGDGCHVLVQRKRKVVAPLVDDIVKEHDAEEKLGPQGQEGVYD